MQYINYKLFYLLSIFILLLNCINIESNNNTNKNDIYFGVEMGYPENLDAVTFLQNTKNEIILDFIHDSADMTLLNDNSDDFNDKLEIINYLYPQNNTKVFLTLTNPINTTIKNVPDIHQTSDFDDPDFINDYKIFIDATFTKIPDTELIGLVVGNEIDIYLANNMNEIESFKNFFIEIKNYIKQKRPGAEVSFSTTLSGAAAGLKSELLDLNTYTDFVCLTYYPDFGSMENNGSVINTDFMNICKIYSKKIYFQECGYPSSVEIGCSEEQQRIFITNLFSSWIKYSDKIKLISLYEFLDMSESDADEYMALLNITDMDIKYYLTSLGLKKSDGQNKEAYNTLVNQINNYRNLF